MIYLISIYLILFAILCWRKTEWALALLIFALPTYLIRFEVFSLPMTLLECMILLIFAIFVIKSTVTHKLPTITLSNYKYLILAFLIVSGFAIYIAGDKMSAVGVWKAYFLEPILFFLVFVNILHKKKHFNLIINAIGASALVVSIPAIIQKFTGYGISNEFWQNEATRRVVSWYGFPNAIGLYLAPIAFLFLGLLVKEFFGKTRGKLNKKTIQKILWYFLVLVLCLVSIYFAKSEGALFGFVAATIFIGLFFPSKKLRIATLGLIIICSTLIFSIPKAREYTFQKITLSDHSGQIRQQQWKETWSMLSDGNELFGAGLSNYQKAVEPYHESGIYIRNDDPDFDKMVKISLEYQQKVWQPTEIYMYPHNIVLNFWTEIGAVGLIVMCLLFLKLFSNYFKVKSQDNRDVYLILFAVFAGILIHGLVDVPYFKNDLSVFWWLLFGLSWVLVKRKKLLQN